MGIKLAKVDVKAYRSIASEGLAFELGSGMNALVGPNNVGKSNVMRAIALGFGEDIDGFKLERDTPANLQWARPTVNLEFRVDRPAGAEKTLLKRAAEIEEDVKPGGRHYADVGTVILRVKYSKEGRQEYLVTRGAGDRRASEALNEKAIAQLRKCVRFVLVRSGEDLSDFLRGRFSEVLGNVLGEAEAAALSAARDQREAYVQGLLDTLMKPLADRVSQELAEVVPEIGGVDLVPSVPGIDETIRNADVRLTDAALTDLQAKGTGVRGGLLVAMLSYLAEHSKRSLVFAVEEPESFLHPRAQEVIRGDLEQLAARTDVTLMTTTHSPLVLSRRAEARVFSLGKSQEGVTALEQETKGDESHTDAIRTLFASALAPVLLEEVAETDLPDPCKAILLVEGGTDVTYLRTAVERCGRPELLADLHLVAGEGAKHAAVQAILWRQRGVAPVLGLFDADVHGKSAKELLTRDFKFQGPHVKTYAQWAGKRVDNAEAEQLLPESLFERFFDLVGEQAMGSKRRAGEGWAYDIDARYKADFASYVEQEATADDLAKFVEALEELRSAANI